MDCSLLGTRLDARSNTTFASQPTWCTSINANQYNCSLFYTQHPTTEGLRLCEPATSGNKCNAGDEFFCSPPPSPPTAPPPPSFPPATCDGRAGRSNLLDLNESPFAVLRWCPSVNANSNDCTLLYTGTPQGVTRLCYPDTYTLDLWSQKKRQGYVKPTGCPENVMRHVSCNSFG